MNEILKTLSVGFIIIVIANAILSAKTKDWSFYHWPTSSSWRLLPSIYLFVTFGSGVLMLLNLCPTIVFLWISIGGQTIWQLIDIGRKLKHRKA